MNDSTMRETADYLMEVADEVDGWADQSLNGWSTHQVKANRDLATKLREKAARLYQHSWQRSRPLQREQAQPAPGLSAPHDADVTPAILAWPLR